MRAFDDPTMPPEPLAAFHAATGDMSLDASLLQIAPAASEIIALVRMQFSRAFARLVAQARHCRDSVQRGLECHRVVSIGARDGDGQWDTASVYDDVPFRSELSSIRRVGAGFLAPRGWKRWRHRDLPAPSRSGRVRAIVEASPNVIAPTRLRLASLVDVASTSYRCQSQAPAASPPMEYRFAAHTGYRSALRGHRPCDVDRLWVTE